MKLSNDCLAIGNLTSSKCTQHTYIVHFRRDWDWMRKTEILKSPVV